MKLTLRSSCVTKASPTLPGLNGNDCHGGSKASHVHGGGRLTRGGHGHGGGANRCRGKGRSSSLVGRGHGRPPHRIVSSSSSE